jgi:hypothetical protein
MLTRMPGSVIQVNQMCFSFGGCINWIMSLSLESDVDHCLTCLLLTNHSCLDSRDSITVYDGRNSQAPMIAQLCNNNRFVNVISTGPDLFIEFSAGLPLLPQSLSNFAQGFQAKYYFYSNTDTSNTYFRGSRPGSSVSHGSSYRRGNLSHELTSSSPRDTLIQIPGTGKKPRTWNSNMNEYFNDESSFCYVIFKRHVFRVYI